MPVMADTASPDAAWTLISLRPAGGHAALRHAAARCGGRLLALSPWRLQTCSGAGVQRDLRQALAAPVVVFTSPAAVRAAAALLPLAPALAGGALAVGAGTARALRRAGVDSVRHPQRMDSEGLLALPALAAAGEVGLVTAPGGRGVLANALAGRGARVRRADVYRRVPRPPSPAALRRLADLSGPVALALSSGEALQTILALLPPPLCARLRAWPVAAASARLADRAVMLGFSRVGRADGPRPVQLAQAARRLALD